MAYDFSKMSVLIVEDSQPMRALLNSLLSAFGVHRVYTANEGKQGLEMVIAKDPDLIITDWMMEPVNGIDFTRSLRTTEGVPNPYVPVIMMTGFSSKFRVEEARDIGVTEFLVKPFTAYELYRRIAQVIEKPRKFVKAQHFFGPDRRRRASKEYSGPMRRVGEAPADETLEATEAQGQETEEIIKSRRASELIREIRKKSRIGDAKSQED